MLKNLEAIINQLLDKVQRDLQASIANAQNDLAEAQNDAQLAQDKETRTHAEKSQRLIQNAIQTMQAISADNESKIAGFNSELNKYQALINKEVTKHTTDVQREIQKAELLRGTELSSFNVQIQDELNEFNGQNSNYQIEIQSKLDKVQRDLQANIADAQNDLAAAQATAQMTTDVNIRNHAEKSQRLIQNAIQTMQSIMADNEANLAKYNADIGKYQAEVNEAIQDYTLSLQEVTQDYNWLKDQYAIVSRDLAQFLQPYIPQGRYNVKLQQMIDQVKKHHPELNTNEIIIMLNDAQDEFSSRTLLLEEATQFTAVANQRYYGLKDSILEVKSVDLTDEDGNAKTIKRLQGRPKYRDLDNV